MESFESNRDELQDDPELNVVLRQWRTPPVPLRVRQALFPKQSQTWWRKAWATSIRVPLPVAMALLVVLSMAAWRWGSRTMIKTERVEVPVIQERVITRTVFRDRNVESPNPAVSLPVGPAPRWRPVTELRPRIIPAGGDRSPNDQN